MYMEKMYSTQVYQVWGKEKMTYDIYLPQFAWIFPSISIIAGYAATFADNKDK